jgi:hypothetical protein
LSPGLQAAYFDPKDHDVQAVVDAFFPADKGVTFKVIHPGANLSRYGHAEVLAPALAQLKAASLVLRTVCVCQNQSLCLGQFFKLWRGACVARHQHEHWRSTGDVLCPAMYCT